MNKALQPLIYALVRELYDKRAEERKVPCVAIESDIKNRVGAVVSEVLSEMVADGVLQKSENINGIRMFAPVNVEKITSNDIL